MWGGDAGAWFPSGKDRAGDIRRALRYDRRASGKEMSGQGAGGDRILVVEDEALVRLLLIDSLEALGWGVVEAATASAALEIFRRRSDIRAAIVDVGLPDMKGDALVEKLRARDADLPIVIASGYDLAGLKHRFAGDDKIVWLSKPYAMAELEGALRGLGVELSRTPPSAIPRAAP